MEREDYLISSHDHDNRNHGIAGPIRLPRRLERLAGGPDAPQAVLDGQPRRGPGAREPLEAARRLQEHGGQDAAVREGKGDPVGALGRDEAGHVEVAEALAAVARGVGDHVVCVWAGFVSGG